jgi:hypothetical protein
MGNGGSCSEVYLVFGLWWLFWLFDWLFVRSGEKVWLKLGIHSFALISTFQIVNVAFPLPSNKTLLL